MEMWKTQEAAFPTFPQGLLRENDEQQTEKTNRGARPAGREHQNGP